MYSIENFDRPSVAADIAVFGIETCKEENKRKANIKKLKVLLIKRGEEPFKNSYSFPGGFVRKNETVEDAALRELHEEAGVSEPKLINLGVYSKPDRDPRGWIISCAYLALTNTVELATDQSSDAAEAHWMDFEYRSNESNKEAIILTNSDAIITLNYDNGKSVNNSLGFDHSQIIYDAFKKLQEEIKYHDLIFDLLPELFTIPELQQVYEAITLKKEAPAGFRRKMSGKIQETDLFEEAAAHRTSKLYKKI